MRFCIRRYCGRGWCSGSQNGQSYRSIILYLIDKIIFLQKETKKNPDTGKRETKETLIFPRYHQFNAVRKLVADVVENHTEKNYLIQHSAGSGKTNTIAWLAHRLASLHDAQDHVIFDTVCIITDRIVVDRQLQAAVLGMEHKAGLVKVMDEKCSSKDLADALNGNTKIIVSLVCSLGCVLIYHLLNHPIFLKALRSEVERTFSRLNMKATIRALNSPTDISPELLAACDILHLPACYQ